VPSLSNTATGRRLYCVGAAHCRRKATKPVMGDFAALSFQDSRITVLPATQLCGIVQ
jgi:hypothetical protein